MVFNRLSRRTFLKRSGIAAAAIAMPPFQITAEPAPAHPNAAILRGTLGLPTDTPLFGRAFATHTAHAAPSTTAPLTETLPADSVHAISALSEDGAWYRLPVGYVQRDRLQLILPYTPPPALTEGTYGEVIAPFSAIRQYCATAAPILERLYFGMVVIVHETLIDDYGMRWYSVSLVAGSPAGYGWLPAAHLAPYPLAGTALAQPAAIIDRAQARLTLYDGGRKIGEAATYSWLSAPLEGILRVVAPSGVVSGISYFRPSLMIVEGAGSLSIPVSGAYWHNRFGERGTSLERERIELSTFAARALYALVDGRGELPISVR
ncbi:MAG TPA: twin-arginine translocation signal domain-containing protein [Aggregatilineales bacterium]|nr:twin-arginine translocation signal domain-containing protein [Anaerolineales bacterium]HRE48447.1 twin-arginine translocation signal domain-containing protein [Aggregatilineales bacterium]